MQIPVERYRAHEPATDPAGTGLKLALLNSAASAGARVARLLREGGIDTLAFDDADDLLRALDREPVGAIIIDVTPDQHEGGMALLSHCKASEPDRAVFALIDRDDAALAVEAVRRGAHDVLTPERLGRLATVCRQALQLRELALRAQAASAAEEPDPGSVRSHHLPMHEVLRGQHPSVVRLRQVLQRLARVDADVLVRAETGCGKEVVARCLHDFGPRAAHRFVAINCGAIPENIFESELFGHEAGAFTGAIKRRIGKLEYACGGTLFLDEIESMPMAMQVKLLRALQQRTIERVGGNESVRLNCRVVAATKDNLLELARDGRFRIDLYYRINVVELAMLPLRERREDIPLLAEGFATEAVQRHGLPARKLDPDFLCGLLARDWEGNVRELRNVVERHLLGVCDLGLDGQKAAQRSLPQLLAEFERTVIEQCLRIAEGSVTRTSDILQVPRKTLYDKLTRLGVDPASFRGNGVAEEHQSRDDMAVAAA